LHQGPRRAGLQRARGDRDVARHGEVPAREFSGQRGAGGGLRLGGIGAGRDTPTQPPPPPDGRGEEPAPSRDPTSSPDRSAGRGRSGGGRPLHDDRRYSFNFNTPDTTSNFAGNQPGVSPSTSSGIFSVGSAGHTSTVC